ncbi:MAG: hypothetical protein ABIQ31_06335 [Ferruginibacter sp.]
MKHLFLAFGILSAVSLQAQPFLSVAGTTKGAGFALGYLDSESGIEFNLGYNVPILRADRPRLLDFSVGKKFLLSHKDEDNISLTSSVGYALYSVKDFSAYELDKEYGAIIQIKKIKAIFGLELGKDWYLGRLYVSGHYCGNPFLSIGMRAFLK